MPYGYSRLRRFRLNRKLAVLEFHQLSYQRFLAHHSSPLYLINYETGQNFPQGDTEEERGYVEILEAEQIGYQNHHYSMEIWADNFSPTPYLQYQYVYISIFI